MPLISVWVISTLYVVVLTPNEMQEDVQEDWGWKLVHGEVFRAPRYPMVLSVMVGNGAQLCAMCAVTLGSSFNIGAFRLPSKITPNSLRIAGFPLTFKPRFSRYCYDGVLDLFWRVSRLFIPRRSTAYAEKSGLEVIIRVEYMHHLVASITERMHFLQPPFSRREPLRLRHYPDYSLANRVH